MNNPEPGATAAGATSVATGRGAAQPHHDDLDLAVRWRSLWAALAGSEPELAAVKTAYSQAHRHYHTLDHLTDCLAHLDWARELAARPAEVEAALWYHDVVYQPRSSRNEEASAAWAQRSLGSAGIPPATITRVDLMILATCHDRELTDPDEQLIADIDLAVLGRDGDGYAAYEEAIRKEYWWVPAALFKRRRGELLRGLLDRPTLYYTSKLRNRYEQQARSNLRRAVSAG